MKKVSNKQQATSDREVRWGYCHVACRMSHVAAFSLIELIIAMAILSVGLFAGMRVFPVGLGASRRAELKSRAAFAAQRTIESLKFTPWDDLADGETATEADGFDIKTRISPTALEEVVDETQLKAVEVTVQWSQDGRSRALTFVTYLRKPSS